jgi:hypothetical protein
VVEVVMVLMVQVVGAEVLHTVQQVEVVDAEVTG